LEVGRYRVTCASTVDTLLRGGAGGQALALPVVFRKKFFFVAKVLAMGGPTFLIVSSFVWSLCAPTTLVGLLVVLKIISLPPVK